MDGAIVYGALALLIIGLKPSFEPVETTPPGGPDFAVRPQELNSFIHRQTPPLTR